MPASPQASSIPPSISEVPPSAERFSSAIRLLSEDDPYPSTWGDRVLLALATLPADCSVEASLTHVLEAASEVMPEHSFGVCLVNDSARRILRLGPAGDDELAPPDPARLFPRRANERSLVINVRTGSSFHVAHDGPAALGESSFETRFIERLATVLASVLRQTTLIERASKQSGELLELQAQVIQSEKLASLGQLAAGVVHELNNPLTSIVAYSDYLRKKGERDGQDPADVERLRRIGEAADRILRFSRDLVDYARPSAGVASAVPLHDVIDQSLVFCEHVLGSTGIVVERTYAEPAPLVVGVASELTQVFVNLFTNACHALPAEGGLLTVRTERGEGVARIEIGDNGHGIDPDLLSKIFEPFFTTKSEGRGTGLGLSIVRNIVERHGGTIQAESDGQGSRFVVVLPVS